MPDYVNEIIIIAILIVFNNILAMSEAALLATRKARLQKMVNEGDKRAGTALEVIEDPNLFLSVIQIGITLIGVASGAVAGKTLTEVVANLLKEIPYLGSYADPIGLTIVVLVITYFSIIFGELVPKRLAIQNPEQIAARVANPMQKLSRLLRPVVRLFSLSTDGILRLIGVRQSKAPLVTEEEIRVLIDQGTRAGIFEAAEQDMVAGVFRLNDRRVNSLMTPRPEMVWLDLFDTPEEIEQKIANSPYSRFPVCQGTLDNILGIVKAKDLLMHCIKNEDLDLKKFLKPALYIPETAFASNALKNCKENNKDIALVIDEHGGVQGLLTINDIVEEIVGDLQTSAPQATQRQDGSWLLDGMLDTDDFKSIFRLGKTLPQEQDYETLGGFVMMKLGKVPQVADQFEWRGLRFEIVDMDGHRVDKVLVTSLPQHPTTE
ncbi:MAG: HlyC/CorC family transporter [Anaerolineales bacterium]|nr:HlyC/CorC family transporter [Anaerolineales bacterium]